MKLPLQMESLPVVTVKKDLTNLKYGTISKWMVFENLRVHYEWSCPEKKNYRRKEIDFENLPLEIRVMLAKQAMKSPSLKNMESDKQLLLVHLAVLNN